MSELGNLLNNLGHKCRENLDDIRMNGLDLMLHIGICHGVDDEEAHDGEHVKLTGAGNQVGLSGDDTIRLGAFVNEIHSDLTIMKALDQVDVNDSEFAGSLDLFYDIGNVYDITIEDEDDTAVRRQAFL